MNPDRQQAIGYLRSPANGLWRWAENGAVLVWRDGATIAFREEILRVLEWLAPNGLPSFGAIALLLAACRGKVPVVAEILRDPTGALPVGLGTKAGNLLSARRQLAVQLEAALGQLEKLATLPPELNTGSRAKCVLAEVVFEPAKVERHVDASAILRGWQEPIGEAELNEALGPDGGGNQVRQVQMVAEGLKPHSGESLALRLRTGLDALPSQADSVLPACERARRLIQELSRDPEHGAVARAARQLLAAVRLPRRLGERDELAVSGVADITNRGPLDRLLLSELAHDDLTLAARIALNEALFLRREPPQREPPGALALLVDSGVRLWGVPRVLAAAVALALIAREKQQTRVDVWRAHGKQLAPVDLLSREGLAEHLGALEIEAHCGEALADFTRARVPDLNTQSVLISHPDTLTDPEFRRALGGSAPGLDFIATLDRNGHFELHAMPLARRPPVCQAELDLDALYPAPAVPLINAALGPNLPAIFGASPFPLLLPFRGRLDRWTRSEDGHTYAILNDRRLIRFRDDRTGGRALASDIPPGKTAWMECIEGTIYVIKAGTSQRPVRLVSVAVSGGDARVVDLASGPEALAFYRYGEVILMIRNPDVRAYSLADGRLLDRALNPHRWQRGRFLLGNNQFHFACWDGQRVKFEPVTLPGSFSPSVVAVIFDREGVDGPWIVHQGGTVISTATGERIKLPLPAGRSFGLETIVVSPDGHRVFASIPTLQWGCLLDLRSGLSQSVPAHEHLRPPLDWPPFLPNWNLQRLVQFIAAWPGEAIALCGGRKGRWWKFALHSDSIRLREVQTPARESEQRLGFVACPTLPKFGCSLQVAQWPNGSKAFLDSRGLLHLKSHDPSVPEVSLVLSDGEVAGWTSDGCVCGPRFFIEGTGPSEAGKVFQRMDEFVLRL